MIAPFYSYGDVGILESEEGSPSVGNWEYYLGEGAINDQRVHGLVTHMIWEEHSQYPYKLPENWFLA